MYPNLEAEMARIRVTQNTMADCIDVTPTTLSLKINGKAGIYLSECMKLRDNFFPTCSIDYLFSTNEMASDNCEVMANQNFGERIKKRRIAIGMSADDLGKRVNKSKATIYRYENGDIENMPSGIIGPFAKALGISPDDLLGISPAQSTSNEFTEPSEENIYKNIRCLRIQKGMTQGELAELAGYTDRSSICKIEAGLVDLSLSKIRTFAKIFNVAASDLIEEDMGEAEGITLGERMRIIRKAAGLKQNEVAERIGVAPSTYSLYESGDREPDLATIGAIAAALDVSPAYLVGWE